MMKKKFFSLLTAIVFCISAFAMTVSAAAPTIASVNYDPVTHTVTATGTCTQSIMVVLFDSSDLTQPLFQYNYKAGNYTFTYGPDATLFATEKDFTVKVSNLDGTGSVTKTFKSSPASSTPDSSSIPSSSIPSSSIPSSSIPSSSIPSSSIPSSSIPSSSVPSSSISSSDVQSSEPTSETPSYVESTPSDTTSRDNPHTGVGTAAGAAGVILVLAIAAAGATTVVLKKKNSK